MKKGALGCLGLFVIITLVIGVGFYRLVYKPFISDYVGGFAQLAEVAELNEAVENRASFAPPAGDVLEEAQVERLLAVQAEMEAELGERVEALQAKYEGLERELEAEGREANYLEALGGFRDVMGLVADAKRVQVAALNRHGFSLGEYAWVRAEAYRAAGIPVLDVGLVDALAAARDGDTAALEQRLTPDSPHAAPAPNRRLVEAHKAQLERMAGLAFFGL